MYLIVYSTPGPRKSRIRQRELVRDFTKTRYMQKPPNIMPNYGKKSPKLGIPKTSLSRVLLYDNITQQQMLDVKLANIKIEKQKAEYLLDMHRKSFALGLANKRQKLRDYSIRNVNRAKLPQLNNRQSRKTPTTTPLLRKFSTFSLEDVHLPEINNHGKQILLKLKTKSGKRKIYHSYDESGIFVDVVPLHTFYGSVKDDPRFQKLQTTLEPADEEDGVDGFVILSPSYEKRYPRIPTFLQELSEESTEDANRS